MNNAGKGYIIATQNDIINVGNFPNKKKLFCLKASINQEI